MARKPRGSTEAVQQARVLLDSTQNAEHLRIAQAVLLPLQGLSLAQAAEIIGRDRFWVSRARNRFMRGEPVPSQHGGRRQALVSIEDELRLVKLAVAQPTVYPYEAKPVRAKLSELLHERTGAIPSASTLTSLLDRVAPLIILGAQGSHLLRLSHSLSQLWRLEQALADREGRTWP